MAATCLADRGGRRVSVGAENPIRTLSVPRTPSVPVDLECLGRDLPVGPHHRGVQRPFRCVAPGSHRVIESYARAHHEGWFDAEGYGPPPTGLPERSTSEDKTVFHSRVPYFSCWLRVW